MHADLSPCVHMGGVTMPTPNSEQAQDTDASSIDPEKSLGQGGLAPDLMAEHLASMYPGLGITDETTLYDYLEQHERDRKGGYAPTGLREAVGIAPADGIDGDDGGAMLSTPLSEALSAEERDKLGDDQFAIPYARQLPMPDATHARLAWSMLSRTEGLSHAEKRQAKVRILAALEKFGVDTTDFDAHDDMRRHKDKDDATRMPLTHDTHRTAGMREAFGDTSGGASDGGDGTMYNPPTKAKANARAGLNWHDQLGHGDDDAVEMAHKIAGHARHDPLDDDDIDAIKTYHKGHKEDRDASPDERRPSAGRVGYLLYGGSPMAAYANDPDHDGDTDTPGAPDTDAPAAPAALTASTGGRAPLAEAALAEAALPASSVADAPATHHGDGSDGNDDRLDIHATGAMAPSSLREAATNVVRHVDRTHRDMEVRIISPGFGASRHGGLPVYYTEAALKPAAPKFKGLKCYLNHPTATERRERPERDVTKWAATMRESWWDPQTNEVRGVMRAYDPWLIDRAAAAPDELALSIDTKGMVAHGTVGGRKAAIVESIDTFGSVDIVTEPGARGGVVRLLESRRVALNDPATVASGDGADNATDHNTDNDTARVVFSEAERHEVRTEMLEQVTLTDLREARGDIVAEIERAAAEKAATDTEARVRTELREAADHDKQTALSVETARQTDLIEAMRKEYEDRLYTMERDLNVRDTRTLVERAVGATALPEAAERRVLAQFTEATCGFGEYATFATPEDLTAQVQAAAEAEKAYIKSVAGPTSVIRGMGAASTGAPTGLTEAASGPLTALREANARLDDYIAKVPTARASAMGGQGAPVIETSVGTGTVGQVAAAATKRLDAILGAA